ncbi:MAG: ice-binding family protein [Archangium sp.]|nr:ice-binding family protein [Archangium sp.]
MRWVPLLGVVLLSACFNPTPCVRDAECGGPGGQCDVERAFCVTIVETDGGGEDAGGADAGPSDAGAPDGGADAGQDAGAPDAGFPDAGAEDAGTPDGGVPDGGVPDAGPADAGPDAGPGDAGPPPVVTAHTPLDLAVNVALDEPITATFSEPMNFTTLTPATFRLTRGVTGLDGGVTLEAALRTATFLPTVPLETNRVYTATLTTAAKGLNGLALQASRTWTFTTALISLRSAQTYSVLGASLTNTGVTTLSGDLGVSTGAPLMGAATITVGGTTHLNDAAATQAHSDLLVAYGAAAALTPTASLATLDGRTLTAGIYTSNAAALALNTTLVLDGQDDPDAVFIFQIDAALNTGATTSSVSLIRGARAANVFWQVSGAVTLGAGSTFKGNLLGAAAITVGAGTALEGRALTLNGVVTLANNTIN